MQARPDFAVIGGQRCGTSTLFHYLKRHPAIVPAAKKEVHFFDLEHARGSGWYLAHFPSLAVKLRARLLGRPFATGEASPYYLFHPLAPRRMAALMPRARLIALLRDPVDRAWSHYHHEVRKGREPLSFEAAIEAEPGRLAGEVERLTADESYRSFAHNHFSYLARGVYAAQLEAWLACFPRRQLLVIKSEDFYADPAATLGEVTAHLGLPPWRPEELAAAVVPEMESWVGRKYAYDDYDPLDEALRRRLAAYFAPHNARLYALLGRDLAWS